MDPVGSERLRGPLPGSDTLPAATEPQPPGPSPGDSRSRPGSRPGGQRHRRRADPAGSGSREARRASGGRGGDFLCPVVKVCERLRSEEREDTRRRGEQKGCIIRAGKALPPVTCGRVRNCSLSEVGGHLTVSEAGGHLTVSEAGGHLTVSEAGGHLTLFQVLSDSENEEPITRRIRHISAFIRKTNTALSSGGQRSRSCSEPVEQRGKLKVLLQPPLTDPVGGCHSVTAGILLSSENSRSVSVPIVPPQRRLAWSAVVPAAGGAGPPGQGGAGPPGQGDGARSSPGRSERSASPDSNDSISEELNHFKPIVCSPCTPPKRLSDGRLLQPRIVKATPRNLRQLRPAAQGTWPQTSAVVMQKWRQIELDRQNVSAAMEGRCPVSVATLTSPVHDSSAASRNRRALLFHEHEHVPLRVPKVPPIQPQDQSLGLRFRSSSKRKQNPKQRESKRLRADANPEANCTDANSYGKRSVKASATVRAQERADRALALQLQRHFDGVSDPYFLRSANQSAERARGLRSSRRLRRHKD